ncbi:hypothetical protein SAMN05444006_11683 [Allgaiera indica]|nr:hypothetical protein SAMN05444006_11683 [Allgaiera indica]
MRIPMGERGVIRLFAIDLPPEQVAAFAEPSDDWPLKAALGARVLDPDYIEAFEVKDVAEIGLTNYLIQGGGINEAAIAQDRLRLDALRGPLVVITSGAFGGMAQEIDPHAPLRWVGTWEEDIPQVHFELLPDASARGEVGAAGVPEGPSLPGRQKMMRLSLAVMIAIAGGLALVLWMGIRR